MRIGRRRFGLRRVGLLEAEIDAAPGVAFLVGERLRLTVMAGEIRLGPIAGRIRRCATMHQDVAGWS